ncbi:MAG: hypothetical protein ACR2IK_20510 [Chloroflexota bacterium]
MLSVRADALWLCVVATAAAGLCGLPYLASAVFGPVELQRIGTFWFVRDFSQYQAAMREGARQSGWLIHDHFSAEPHAAALVYPLYVAAGKLSALLGLNGQTVFVALEWIGRAAVVAAAYAFSSTFVKPMRQRRLAVLLTLATLGLDALGALLRMLLDASGVNVFDGLLPQTINPYLEMSSLGVLLSAPHLMLGLALTLVCAPLYLGAIQGRGGGLALLGAAMLGLSLVHAFNAPMLVSVLVAHAAVTGRRAWPAAIVAGLAAAPMAVYSLLLFQADAFWAGTYGAQNIMPAPAPWSLPLDFGLVMLAAPLAWPVVRRWPSERRWLLLLWVGLGLVWMYAPVPYQRRFGFGVQPGLAVLGAIGLFEVDASVRIHHLRVVWRRLISYSAIIAGISTSLLVYVSVLVSAMLNHPAEVYLWSRPEAAAAAWLGANSTAQDVVLASVEFGNPLAGAIDGRVVDGHTVATLHSAQKDALVHSFYAFDAPVQERTDIVQRTGATIIALGPAERALGATELSSQPGFHMVYDRQGVQLFRVVAQA